MGVDLILCGHLHVSHIEPLEIVPEKHRIIIASAGTATSSRGRLHHTETNFYNLIDVDETSFVVEERRYQTGSGQFELDCSSTFERTFVR